MSDREKAIERLIAGGIQGLLISDIIKRYEELMLEYGLKMCPRDPNRAMVDAASWEAGVWPDMWDAVK